MMKKKLIKFDNRKNIFLSWDYIIKERKIDLSFNLFFAFSATFKFFL